VSVNRAPIPSATMGAQWEQDERQLMTVVGEAALLAALRADPNCARYLTLTTLGSVRYRTRQTGVFMQSTWSRLLPNG
jgi:hypothetical protein